MLMLRLGLGRPTPILLMALGVVVVLLALRYQPGSTIVRRLQDVMVARPALVLALALVPPHLLLDQVLVLPDLWLHLVLDHVLDLVLGLVPVRGLAVLLLR